MEKKSEARESFRDLQVREAGKECALKLRPDDKAGSMNMPEDRVRQCELKPGAFLAVKKQPIAQKAVVDYELDTNRPRQGIGYKPQSDQVSFRMGTY